MMRAHWPWFLLAALLFVASCPPPQQSQPIAAAPTPVEPEQPGQPAPALDAAQGSAPAIDAGAGGTVADGQPCADGADCQSGICEGEGCGDTLGTCAPRNRACTRDLRAYCGCDGQTFRGSGSCPLRRFAHRGECGQKKADGDKCSAAADCQSGICEGQGCGAGAGVCAPRDRMCTSDLVPYCGCDGATFDSSSGCPGRLYAYRGSCKKQKN